MKIHFRSFLFLHAPWHRVLVGRRGAYLVFPRPINSGHWCCVLAAPIWRSRQSHQFCASILVNYSYIISCPVSPLINKSWIKRETFEHIDFMMVPFIHINLIKHTVNYPPRLRWSPYYNRVNQSNNLVFVHGRSRWSHSASWQLPHKTRATDSKQQPTLASLENSPDCQTCTLACWTSPLNKHTYTGEKCNANI